MHTPTHTQVLAGRRAPVKLAHSPSPALHRLMLCPWERRARENRRRFAVTWRMPTVPARQRAEGGLTGTRPLGAEDANTAPAGKRGQRFKRAEGKEMLPALARLAEKGPLIHM